MNYLISFLFILNYLSSYNTAAQRNWVTTDELENHISPEDLHTFLSFYENNGTDTRFGDADDSANPEEYTTELPVPESVDCFGLGPLTKRLWKLFNMRPDSSSDVNTHFYFSSRKQRDRVQVYPGTQFGMEWVDFDPARRTVMIVHGFMSHSNASWVAQMTDAFLEWNDVNVIAVDWSGGGNTWKYWRAVANTRRVGSDVVGFMKQLIGATGASVKKFHFVGHSLGAHIVSYVSYHIGIVGRITGLDPAQPCFSTASRVERLDDTDADFVDVIHTNGRLLQRLGFGLPEPIGHADFYPNGGMKQPGCLNESNSVWSRILPISPAKLQQAICSHGRSYLLFTESLINNNCSFRAHQWNLTYEGVNSSIAATCVTRASCSEMGIRAAGGGGDRLPKARGAYFVLTTSNAPYCPSDYERRHPRSDLLMDLVKGFSLNRTTNALHHQDKAVEYADPDIVTDEPPNSTTKKNWFLRLFG